MGEGLKGLFGLAGDLALVTARDAYILDCSGALVCRNGEAVAGLPEGALVERELIREGRVLGSIAANVDGLGPELRKAMGTTVHAYAMLACLGGYPQGEALFDSIRAYILGHLNDDLTGDVLAAALYVSRSTISRAVKAGSEKPLRLYIQALRLDAARALLIESSLPITQVAERCGVSDFNYFSRIYKKRFGQTPTQTRAGVKG